MMPARALRQSDPAPAPAEPRPDPADPPDLDAVDFERVVWDVDYRARVKALLNPAPGSGRS